MIMNHSLLSFLVVLSILLSGCSGPPAPTQSPITPVPDVVGTVPLSTVTPASNRQAGVQDFSGRVVAMDGNPVAGAKIESVDGTATSDSDGWFRFAGGTFPQWLKASASGFISRTRAAKPGVPVLFRLSPDDGKTIVLHFGGDTMFARRFFDPNQDDFTTDGLLPPDPSVEDHLRLLNPVQPLLENADFTILNFETTLSEEAFTPKSAPRPAAYHPTAAHVYASHPNSVMALKQSGVDIVDLGHNHTYDLLEVGLNNTLAALDQAGVFHFGAGTNEANAWTPAIISSKGQTIAFIGCTTMRIPLRTPIPNDVTFTAFDVLHKGGAAYCSEVPLRSAIAQAKLQANMVVVMIHGGKEYDRNPTTKIAYLTEIARRAGASLIINHQPHVVGGFTLKNETLTAWTMGTFLADQLIWPALESYLLTVHVREGKVVRAYIEPLIIEGFLPHGLTGELAEYVAREAAGRESGPFLLESGTMEIDFNGVALQHTYTQTLDGGASPGMIVPVPHSQWLSAFKGAGTLLLGRDLLWVGGFENEEVNSLTRAASLWDLEMGNIQIGPDYAYEGGTGIRLSRGAANTTDATTTNLHRVLVNPSSKLSITGMIRLNRRVAPIAQLSWYSETDGPSFSRSFLPIEVENDGEWHPFRIDVQVPSRAKGLGLYLRLKPPDIGTGTADFDNVRIIQWAKPSEKYSPLYDHLLLTGPGELTFIQQILPGAEAWVTGPADDPNK
jgi:poly-gamma-glutamate synthesis protein (capsule biosynthesis protein)